MNNINELIGTLKSITILFLCLILFYSMLLFSWSVEKINMYQKFIKYKKIQKEFIKFKNINKKL